ncbi:MAG: pirin family protein [Bacteroidota bacterium]|nr:pirin family protein [Flavobacteriales bacterium]MEC7085626.1 pirin family protein [Bacteroidota bacterium]MED5363398.1 pirin family protein [Bacteroidota bacterium]MEE3020953.1 pirin family protein [Bacteroidota bacterium]|tara:strand:+ start:635 stop:1354 length:720 start_codon:yes stop_codon:yes gene_type:complete
MKTVFHPSDSRGYANHGWLEARHSFSFASWYQPDRLHFGALRVLNDDIIQGGMGFGTHPHDNMEIVTIPLKGDLEHKDSMGNSAVIREGDIQVMSAGTGVQHSEYNNSPDKEINLFQLWLFPNKQNVKPRYDQLPIRSLHQKNEFFQILSPSANDQGVWIHQDAWMHILDADQDQSFDYVLQSPENGVYLIVIEGEVEVDNQTLFRRDAIGIWETDKLTIKTKTDAELLLVQVPMLQLS